MQKKFVQTTSILNNKKGFSFTEVMIAMSLFILMAGVGVGAYFKYYHYAFVNADVNGTLTLIKQTRFLALKNPTNSDYGVHLDPATGTITGFKSSYTPGQPDNNVFELSRLDISAINLLPSPGVTHDILFEKQTAKTQNSGTFTIGDANYSYTFTINSQGVID